MQWIDVTSLQVLSMQVDQTVQLAVAILITATAGLWRPPRDAEAAVTCQKGIHHASTILSFAIEAPKTAPVLVKHGVSQVRAPSPLQR